MRPHAIASLLALLTLLPATAHAWQIRMQCNGDASIWPDAIIDMRLHPHWGDPATDWGRAFDRTLRAWNEVAGAWPVFRWRRVARLDTIRFGDGHSDAVPVAAETIDGAMGATRIRRALCPGLRLPWPRTAEIIEADVMINEQHPRLYRREIPNCDGLSGQANGVTAHEAGPWRFTREATLMHELGHALGLGHEDEAMSVMMTSNGEGRYCGTPQFAPHPDDTAAMQALYRDRQTQHDLAASAFEWIGANAIDMTMPRRTLRGCPGQLVTMRWSVANRGTEPVTYDIWWHASPTPAINSPDDVLLKVERARHIEPGRFETHETTLRLSRHLPPGVVHHVGFQLVPAVDHEIHHNNNLSYTATRIALRAEEECR